MLNIIRIASFADILAIADCLDTATDYLGRPYPQSKRLGTLIEEFRAGSGTHYGPEAVAALSVPKVRDHLHYLITDEREKYITAFILPNSFTMAETTKYKSNRVARRSAK